MSLCGADVGLNMEARLRSPQRGQLGASVGGCDNVTVKAHMEPSI